MEAGELQREVLAESDSPSADHAEDRQLVGMMVAREPSAWQTFVNLHGRVIRARVADVAASFGCSSDSSAIDDATADVFASLLANDSAALRAFAGRSSLLTYVAIIATRCATRNFARRRYSQKNQSPLDNDEAAADVTQTDPALRLLEDEQRDRLRSLLEELPDKQREVVRLFHLEGQSYAHISQVLEMPLGSVGVTLRRAEAKLRRCMETES